MSFYYDEQGNIKKDLFSNIAKSWAIEKIKPEGRKNSETQLRKFYEEVVNFKMQLLNKQEQFNQKLPYIKMINAKINYSYSRELINKVCKDFLEGLVNEIETYNDFVVFANFFEAFIGYYKFHDLQTKMNARNRNYNGGRK